MAQIGNVIRDLLAARCGHGCWYRQPDGPNDPAVRLTFPLPPLTLRSMARFADRASLPSIAGRYALALFFALAYLFSWLIWELAGMALDIILLAGPRLSCQPQPTIGAASPRQSVAEFGGH